MTGIVLFRYDRDFPVCEQALRLLRLFNPGMGVHGLYGGLQPDDLPATLTRLLDTNWTIPGDDSYHKWKDGDLCVRDWYRAEGRNLAFDHIYLIEWDMLCLKPLSELYGPLEPDVNYGTFFTLHAYRDVRDWFFLDQHRHEVAWMIDRLAQGGMPVALETLSFGKMVGVVFCRAFLDKFGASPVPSYSNDEVRFSVYSAAFGFPLRDNGIAIDARNSCYVDGEMVFTAADVDRLRAQGGGMIHPVRIVVEGLEAKLSQLY